MHLFIWLYIYIVFINPCIQRALRNKQMEMPEPTQWENNDGSTACELKDPLDSVPCTESEDSESDYN